MFTSSLQVVNSIHLKKLSTINHGDSIMKCIKSIETNEITKVSDYTAEHRVTLDKTHIYVPKRDWKVTVRDIKKVKEVVK